MSQVIVTLADHCEQRRANRWLTRPRFVAFVIVALSVQAVLIVVFAIANNKPCRCEASKEANSSASGLRSELEMARTQNNPTLLVAGCEWPVKKYIMVNSVYGTANKEYTPPCVPLYRCGADAGCCSASEECVAKSQVNVTLSLIVTEVMAGGVWRTNRSVPLVFSNHTECVCSPHH